MTAIPLGDPSVGPHWNGWSPTPANTRFQPADQAGLSVAQVPNLKLKWAFGFPDTFSAYGQPTVAAGRVFIGTQNGTVYSLDAKTGCTYWTFKTQSAIRAATTVGARRTAAGERAYSLYVADQSAHVYALDAQTGDLLWAHNVDDTAGARVTGAPTLYQPPLCSDLFERGSDRAQSGVSLLQVLREPRRPGSQRQRGVEDVHAVGEREADGKDQRRHRALGTIRRGHLERADDRCSEKAGVCLDGQHVHGAAADHERRRDRDGPRYRKNPMGVAASAERRLDRGVSARRQQLRGERRRHRSRLRSRRFADARETPSGKDAIVVGQKSGQGWALDPDKKGAVLWEYRAGRGTTLGGIEWGPAVDAQNAYFAVSDFALENPGGLHAVNLVSGQRAWMTPAPRPICTGPSPACGGAQSAAVTVIPGVVFSGSADGGLRAYSTIDGNIVWTFDANREFQTVNGVKGNGASFGGAGPVIVGGMLFTNSGYGPLGGRPGNVLLAFGVE
jgi:polyvinyl alcohol dehydrogenase (cytochrome)